KSCDPSVEALSTRSIRSTENVCFKTASRTPPMTSASFQQAIETRILTRPLHCCVAQYTVEHAYATTVCRAGRPSTEVTRLTFGLQWSARIGYRRPSTPA